MSEAAIADFMVKAGAFAVRGTGNSEDEIKRLAVRLAAVKPLLTEPETRAVGRACAAIIRDGASEEAIGKLLTALAGRHAALSERKAAEAPGAVAAMAGEGHLAAGGAALLKAGIAARLPYKDD